MGMTDEQATDILTAFIEPVLDVGFPPNVIEDAIWMELESKFGPLVYEAFYLELDVEASTLSVGPRDRYLAEKLLKRHLPLGNA